MVTAGLGLFDGILQAVQVKDPPLGVGQVSRERDTRSAEVHKIGHRSACESRCVYDVDHEIAPLDRAPTYGRELHRNVSRQDLGGLLRVVVEASTPELAPEGLRILDQRQFGGRRDHGDSVADQLQAGPCNVAPVVGPEDPLDLLPVSNWISVEHDAGPVPGDGRTVRSADADHLQTRNGVEQAASSQQKCGG